MFSFLARRMITVFLPTLLGFSMLVFGAMHLIPGSFVDVLLGVGQDISEEQRQRVVAQYGLDQPVPVQYVKWLGNVFTGDFGTSRFLEIAAHGTTVIGSPPYMAPEQFQGKAVFASDVYSIGVTMYQMLTGELPYNTPTPSDLDRLLRGELVSPPRLKNARIPKAINDIVMRALQVDLGSRYARAGDLLRDVLDARDPAPPRRPGRVTPVRTPAEEMLDMKERLKSRDTPPARFCWHCRKPLHARTDKCPFCNERQ